MSFAKPFINPDICGEKVSCLLCEDVILKYEISYKLSNTSWKAFKNNAEKWAAINVPLDDERYAFTNVYSKVVNSESPFGVVHDGCRIQFGTRIDRYQKKYGTVTAAEGELEMQSNVTSFSCPVEISPPTFSRCETRSQTSKPVNKRHCFVCDETRDIDDNPYNNGGLGKCRTKISSTRLKEKMELFLQHPTFKFYDAARRLERMVSGDSHDIISAGIFYHQSCYLKFAVKAKINDVTEELEAKENKKETVLDIFHQRIKSKIIRERCAFLLNELLVDMKILSEEQGLDEPPINNTRSLKRYVAATFGDEISFFPKGKYLLVHASEMNPCEYSIATLHGCGLRDEDLARAFGKMITRKAQDLNDNMQWPLTPQKLLEVMDNGPIPELFNAIYYSVHGNGKLNEFGYVETQSPAAAIKIWSLASDWESLITRRPNPKTTTMGLVIHRLTRSKEVIDILHKSNHCISYQDIRLQNSAWSRMYQDKRLMFSNMRKGVSTHSTIDNNDGNQETVTGTGTTHDTNKTLFQLPSKSQVETIPTLGNSNIASLDIEEDEEEELCEPTPYEIGIRSEPPLFLNYKDDVEKDSEIEKCLLDDIAWSMAGSLSSVFEDEDLPLLGSWTSFKKLVTTFTTEKCIQEYLPVTPHAPEYPVCKDYLDFMLEILEELELDYMFLHSDEAVYSKLCHILWNHQDLYKDLISLMGGFHQLRVKQKLLHKRHFCRGFKQWAIDAGIIAAGSGDQAWEGRHYYRCMRVHKECFDALVQFRFEELTSFNQNIPADLKECLVNLRKNPCHESLETVLCTDSFRKISTEILRADTAESSGNTMTIEYLKDVSSMLAMVSAVREGCLERHLQAEREMLKQTFAFGHHNYSRYMSYQHVLLRSMEQSNHPAILDLKSNGFGGSISGEPFSSIHGDLITELFNKETKGNRGPIRAGFSTNHDAVNAWVATLHIHAKVKEEFKKLLMLKTSSKHKELTNGGKTLHFNHVNKLKQKLKDYGVNPYDRNPAQCISTGIEIAEDIRRDMVKAPDIGNQLFLSFVNSRLRTRTVSFFAPINKPKLNTGIKKSKKTKKEVDVIKEDRQAFGMLVAKSVSLEEALNFPITSVPLAAANPDRTLRQSNKSSLRNLLINSSSSNTVMPKKCTWLVDGMAVIRTVKPQETYKAFFQKVLSFIEPPYASEAVKLGMINDRYPKDSTKEGTRRTRGEDGGKVSISGVDQHMLKGLQWQGVLNRSDNKEEIVASLTRYVTSKEGLSLLKYPFIITSKEDTYTISDGKAIQIENCNHEEADTRLVLHAFLTDGDVVIVATDTDILILMIWVYHTYNVRYKWYFKYKGNKYADISKICGYLGSTLCSNILSLHAISGCDTTSYLFSTGKVKMLSKVINDPVKANLLNNLGVNDFPCEKNLDSVKEFIRTVFYNGKKSESYIQTRISKFKRLVNKTSAPLPPDEDSLKQVILRAHLQVFIWRRCTQMLIEEIPYEDYGWKWSEEKEMVVPVWFTGYQFPKGLRSKKSMNVTTVSNHEADDEDEDVSTLNAVRKRKKISKTTESKRQKLPSGYEADVDLVVCPANTSTGSVIDDTSDEDCWEVSDFCSTDDSGDEWNPDL